VAKAFRPRPPVKTISLIAFLFGVKPFPETRRARIKHRAEHGFHAREKLLMVSGARQGHKFPSEHVRRAYRRQVIFGEFVADRLRPFILGHAEDHRVNIGLTRKPRILLKRIDAVKFAPFVPRETVEVRFHFVAKRTVLSGTRVVYAPGELRRRVKCSCPYHP